MLRSIGSVILGYIVMAVITIAGTAAATALLIPGGMAAASRPGGASLTRSYLAANIAVSLLGAAAGGYLAARIAPGRPMVHVAILAVLMVAMSILSARSPAMSAGQPGWYKWTLPILGVVGALAGGVLRTA